MPKESEIQRNIKEYLQWNGWFVVKIHQSLGSYKGIADLYAIKGGRSVWIEVKTPKGKQSEHQFQFQQDIEAHGGEYILARGIEDVERLIRSCNNCKHNNGLECEIALKIGGSDECHDHGYKYWEPKVNKHDQGIPT